MTEPTITRADLVERMARWFVRSRGSGVIASDEHWPVAMAHHREMSERYPMTYPEASSLMTDAFRDAGCALAAIDDANHAVVTRSELPESVRRKAKDGTWESLVEAADLAKEWV